MNEFYARLLIFAKDSLIFDNSQLWNKKSPKTPKMATHVNKLILQFKRN